jgi:hypothetical protein
MLIIEKVDQIALHSIVLSDARHDRRRAQLFRALLGQGNAERLRQSLQCCLRLQICVLFLLLQL